MRIGAAAHLGGDGESGVGALGEQAADEGLAAPVTVDVGGVEEGDSRLDRRVEHRHRVGVVDLAPVTPELPATETDDGDLTTGATELTCLHGSTLRRA